MTNRERNEALPTGEYVTKIRKLFQQQFAEHIDFDKFLDSEDEDITHFIRHHGKCRIKPSEMELRDNPNAKGIEKALFLNETTMMGMEYAVIADLENMRLIKTPMDNVVMV